MNIFLQEFKMRFRSVATWSVAVAGVLFVFLSLFPSFALQADAVNELMSRFPPQLLTAFGLKGVDLSTVPGYFGFIFLFVQLCLAIQAANYGFSMVSIEEREWTADFLLTKPVGRSRVITGKLLAALCGLTVTNGIVWVSTFASLGLFHGGRTYAAAPLLLLLLSIVIFQLFFLSVGLVVSLLVKRIRSVTPYAKGLALGMYVLSAFGDLLGASVLEKLTPFKHFDPIYILQHRTFDLPLVMVSAAAILISLVGSYVLYTRRDIPAVS
jgi:ABC-2 type transport system permease protein